MSDAINWTIQPNTPPTLDPVSLVAAKTQLRVDIADEDAFIDSLVTTATRWVEDITGRSLMTQTWELYLDDWPSHDYIRLPRPPLQSVTSVIYYDTDGDSSTFPTDYYDVDTDSEPGRVVLKYNESWPSETLQPKNPIKITYLAGYEDYSGTVDVTDTTVAWASGDKFSTEWHAGKAIEIDNTEYAVVSISDDETLTINSAPGNDTGLSYQANDVPLPLVHAIKLMVGQLYTHREPTITGSIVNNLPLTMQSLLANQRIWSVYP